MSEETTPTAAPTTTPPKSRLVYILLALFLGGLGVHNFYAGRKKQAIIQLVLTITLCWTGIVPLGVAIWVIIEMIKVTQSADGQQMV